MIGVLTQRERLVTIVILSGVGAQRQCRHKRAPARTHREAGTWV